MSKLSVFILDSSPYGKTIEKSLSFSGYDITLYRCHTTMLVDAIPTIKPDVFIISSSFDCSCKYTRSDLVKSIRDSDPRVIIIGFVGRKSSEEDIADLYASGYDNIAVNSVSMIKNMISSLVRKRIRKTIMSTKPQSGRICHGV